MLRRGLLCDVLMAWCFAAGCVAQDRPAFSVERYVDGEVSSLTLSDAAEADLWDALSELVGGSTEMLRLMVSEELIESIKSEECLEILISRVATISSVTMGDIVFQRILIPLSGDYAGDDAAESSIVFVGDESYFTGPLGNPKGYPIVLRILRHIESGSG